MTLEGIEQSKIEREKGKSLKDLEVVKNKNKNKNKTEVLTGKGIRQDY